MGNGGEVADIEVRWIRSGFSAAVRRPAAATLHGHGGSVSWEEERREREKVRWKEEKAE